MRLVTLLLFVSALLIPAAPALAQTGKVSGAVTDATTGESLPGVNVSLEGTTQGAVTDAEGYYDIINVRPGTYAVRASFIGFTPVLQEEVRVSTGLTSEVNFELREETVGLDELVVSAERPIVQLDVSANVASLTPEEFVDLPVAGVSEILDLQAGIEPGLQIRGGGMSELAFVVDGMNLRAGRDQDPFTNISYTSVEEVQVQTGGFNAEYGNVRAGVINVTTKEPPRTRYTFDGLFRFTPAQDKAFDALGALPENCDYSDPNNVNPTCDAYWIRPLFDPAVAMEGSADGEWDAYTQRQYNPSDGLVAAASDLQGRGFDVSAEDMKDYYRNAFRKDNSIDIPDYQADFTLGGPLVPGLSAKLGDLRFLLSYRGTQTAYSIPQTRDSFDSRTVQGKLMSNIRQGMKLTVHGMYGTERGMLPNGDNSRVTLWQGNLPNYPWQGLDSGGFGVQPVVGIQAERGDAILSDALMNRGDIDHRIAGLTFTHTLNNTTFYEVNLQNVASKYRAHFANMRQASFVCPSSGIGPNGESCSPHSVVGVGFAEGGVPTGAGDPFCFGGGSDITGDGEARAYCIGLTDDPFGYSGQSGNLIGSTVSTGGHWNKTRDTSDVNIFSGRFDLTSQINRFLQVKTGAELILSNYDILSQRLSQELGFFYEHHEWDRTPIQGATYLQSKLEFQGMIANVGVRLDYFNPNSEWWVFENPYDPALRGQEPTLDELLPKEDPGSKVYLSPRVGVSFPITENSKLYFNYGHFRQMLNPFDIFGIQSTPAGGIDVIGNPNHPMPQTVAYELGFDQNLFDLFLLRVSGFYRDIREQDRGVTFNSLGSVVSYVSRRPWNYEDVRGAEFTLSKNRGAWIRGFVNFTYLQTKSGNFGFASFFENSFDQLTYLRTSTDYRQFAPVAEPFARMNLLFLTPSSYGPDVAGLQPLSDWRVSLLGEWRDGQKWTWAGEGNFPEIQNNVAWRDFWDFDLRLTKHFNSRFADLQIFLDVDNVFNRRHLYGNAAFGGGGGRDFNDYMRSLHLADDIFDGINAATCVTANVDIADCSFEEKRGLPYVWVPGDDQPGLFRDDDVDFQPIEGVEELPESGNDRAWYWEQTSDTYSRWNGSAWEPVPEGEVQRVLDDKAYIDMPNFRFNTFLNPRRYTFGLRLTF